MNFVSNNRASPGQNNLILLMRGKQLLFRSIQGVVHPRTCFTQIHTFKDYDLLCNPAGNFVEDRLKPLKNLSRTLSASSPHSKTSRRNNPIMNYCI